MKLISSANNVTAAAASKAGKVQRLEIKVFFSRIKTFPCHGRQRRRRRRRRRQRHRRQRRRRRRRQRHHLRKRDVKLASKSHQISPKKGAKINRSR